VAEARRLLGHPCAAGREGQGHRRRRRRRVRASAGSSPRYDARSGREAWRFYTIPAAERTGRRFVEACPPASDTFCDPEAWKHGGGSVWVTGSYDPALNPDVLGRRQRRARLEQRAASGDNLYTDSVVALDADSGRLKWHYQFTPHDRYDYDSVQVPVLADITWQASRSRRWSGRTATATSTCSIARPEVPRRQAVRESELDGQVRRARRPNQTPQPPVNQRGPAIRVARTGTRRLTARTRGCSTFRRGKATRRSSAAPVEYQEGGTLAAAPTELRAGSRRARRARHPARPDQQLDRSGRHRRGARGRRRHGEQKWKFR
jgi:hypothetical protein